MNYFNSIEPLILTDDARPVATNAKVRIVHAAPSAQDVAGLGVDICLTMEFGLIVLADQLTDDET